LLVVGLIYSFAVDCVWEFHLSYVAAENEYNENVSNCNGVYAEFCKTEAIAIFNHNVDIALSTFDDCMKSQGGG